MGKGDKKSKRGKIVIGSFGIRRPRKKSYVPVKVDIAQVEAKPVKEKTTVNEVKESAETAVMKQPKPVKEKKEPKTEKSEKVAKPKKE